MKKFQTIKIIVVAVVISVALDVFFGRLAAAKISTWPLLNRLRILNPQAPIVINNHETVRVSDSGDAVQAVNNVKSKISLVILVSASGDAVTGAAINLTSDGEFATAGPALAKASGSYYVLLSDGRSGKISGEALDPATSLIFFKTGIGSVPTANIGSSAAVNSGDEILFAANSLQNSMGRAIFAKVNTTEADIAGQTFQSDYPRRGFMVEPPQTLLPGQVLADADGNVLGIWNGSAVISSDVLKQAMDLYFNGNGSLARPEFGFSYSIITQNDSQLTGQSQGALVKLVSGAAKQAGLESGDIITSINGQAVSESSPPEAILQNYKPGDRLSLSVIRKNQSLTLTLIAGELKNGNS